MSVLASRIRQRRDELGLTQGDLAQSVGKNQRQIWEYEKGRVEPSAYVVARIADTLNTSTDWLLGRTDNPDRPLRNSPDLTDSEREIFRILRSKSTEHEEALLTFIKSTW